MCHQDILKWYKIYCTENKQGVYNLQCLSLLYIPTLGYNHTTIKAHSMCNIPYTKATEKYLKHIKSVRQNIVVHFMLDGVFVYLFGNFFLLQLETTWLVNPMCQHQCRDSIFSIEISICLYEEFIVVNSQQNTCRGNKDVIYFIM